MMRYTYIEHKIKLKCTRFHVILTISIAYALCLIEHERGTNQI